MILHTCESFEILRAHELFMKVKLIDRCDPDHNIGDYLVR